MCTVIIYVYLLKSKCIPNFVFIGCCVSELCAHLCPYLRVSQSTNRICRSKVSIFSRDLLPGLYCNGCGRVSCHGSGNSNVKKKVV